MYKKYSVPAILLLLLFTFVSPIAALDATPGATPSINEITENLRERLQDTLNGEALKRDRLYAYVGVVKDIIKSTVVIEDKEGKRNIIVDQNSKITRSPGNTAIKLDSIRIDDSIIAIGQYEGEEIKGKKIIVSADSFAPPKKISGIGEIEKLNKSSLNITTASGTATLDIASKTIVKSSEGLLEYGNLKVGDRVVYAGTDDKGDYTATIIFRVKSAE